MNKILIISVCTSLVLAVVFILYYYNDSDSTNSIENYNPSFQDGSYKVVLIDIENNSLTTNPSVLKLDSKAHSIVWKNLSEYPLRIILPSKEDFRIPYPDYLNTVIEPNGFTVLTLFDEGQYQVNIITVENKEIEPISVFENSHSIIFETDN
jgi:hypothetical protein